MKQVIPVVAACILKRHPLRVLLHLKGETRNPTSRLLVGNWELPGGVVEYGETPEQALEREIREELGIIIQVNKLLHARSNVYSDKQHYLVLFYECQTSYQSAPKGCRYYTPDEVKQLNCLPGTYEVINKIIAEQ